MLNVSTVPQTVCLVLEVHAASAEVNIAKLGAVEATNYSVRLGVIEGQL